jgi:N-acetylmuramoyl-L-alanine amidase
LAQGIRVYYTREDDSSRSPEERVGFANALQADMLISVHVTSAEDTKVYGIRTEYNAQYFIPDFSSADLAYLLLKLQNRQMKKHWILYRGRMTMW